MEEITLLLQKSASLYKFLTILPKEEDRDDYIEDIHSFLDERDEIIQRLQQSGFRYNEKDQQHKLLYELDLGIKERLLKVMDDIKNDLIDLQMMKKKEIQYINPYQNLYNQEGRYYDGKK